ncbi:MAG: GRP family sugar transporter [Tannerellaceae bacterium]|jgi:glucose uptake protein|nr:GRP family sugar transporter [Tannerellaceae bacterium]
MFIVENYPVAILLCVVTMLCWGSWGNTQKLVAKSWRYELFYWDYVIGIVVTALALGFTLGSIGEGGRSFVADLSQVEASNFWSAFAGGVIFNAANILLSAAVALAGMSVAFPVGVGLALAIGVFVNYFATPKGDPLFLFSGVALVVVAVVVNGIASGRMSSAGGGNKSSRRGLMLSVAAGILMSLFYRFVAAAMDLDNFVSPVPGMATPYSAFFIFSLGVLASNFIFNTIVMKKPFTGEPVAYGKYFAGSIRTHSVGILGGVIWGLGTLFSYIAAGKAGAAISYALGQGAPMIAALWGIFIWKEFKDGPKSNNILLTLMIIFFLAGLGTIVYAGL